MDRDLSDALGQAWVEKYFPPEAKRRMRMLVENLRTALRDSLEHSDWMTPATRKNAILKLDALEIQIGYPDRWKDYAPVEIKRNTFFENVRAAWTFGQQGEIARVGKPVDHVRLGHDAAHGERVFEFRRGESRVPGGNSSTPVFRYAGR